MRIRCVFPAALTPARLLCVLSLCGLPLTGCGDGAAEQAAARQRDAIRHVLELDAALARSRDQAMATKDLATVAAGVRKYVAAVGALDFSALPEDVRTAYAKHVDTWRTAAGLFEYYSGLGGMLRVTFDGEAFAKSRLDEAQKAVEQSWEEVKAKAKAYGVDAPG